MRAPRSLSAGALRPALAGLILIACAVLVWRRWDDLTQAWSEIEAWRFVASGVAAVIGTLAIERSWFALLRGLGADVPQGAAARMFFLTQMGKYLPGSVWPVVAQMEFGVRWGLGRTVMFVANLLLLGVVTATGILTGAALLPWASPSGVAGYGWLFLLLIPLAVVLHPRTLPRMLAWLLAKAGREPFGQEVSWVALGRSAGWMLVAWLVLGAHLIVVMAGFESVDGQEAAAAIGAIALGWAAGIAFLPAPAGAGVRDGVILLVLTPLIGSGPALVTALTSRVVLMLADVALAGISLVRGGGGATSVPDTAASE